MISSALEPGPAVASPRSFRDDPVWARPALAALLVLTAVLYLWGLGASGWANSFYSAAVQAGAHSWKAFFFGSSDAANFITVDKTPLSLWPMELSARLFGVNSWSILVPQALMGVATVAVLYATVRRSLLPFGVRAAAGGGLLAGAVLATTPVAALMFRFNNPDALLVLLLTVGAYALLRAQSQARTSWLLLAASCVGLGFLAKMLQAFLVVPAFGLAYLLTAPTPLRRRLWQLTLAGVALVVSAGWWVAVVAAVPASSRPYIGGSQHDSVLELAFGYNGLGRLNGNETGGLGNTNQDAGWLRMFDPELGGQIAWLLPAALVLLAAGLWVTLSRPARPWSRSPDSPFPTRPHAHTPARAGLPPTDHSDATGQRALPRLWPIRTGASTPRGATVLSRLRSGAPARPESAGQPAADTTDTHPDQDHSAPTLRVSLPVRPGSTAAPDHPAGPALPEFFDGGSRTDRSLAAFLVWGAWLLVTDVVFSLMQGIFHGYYTVALAPPVAALVGIGATVLWLGRRRPTAAIALAGAVALTAWWCHRLLGRTPDFAPWLRLPVLIGGLLAAFAILTWRRLPARLLVATAALAVAASLAGPAAYAVDTATTPKRGAIPTAGPSSGGPGGMGGPGRFPAGARAGFPGGAGGSFGRPAGGGGPGGGGPGGGTGSGPGRSTAGGPGGAMRPGGMGGPGALLDAATPSATLTAYLKQNATSYTWAAATIGSNSAAGYQLATGRPVMAIGGFNGTDPAPSLTRFEQLVRAGRIHYFISGTTMRGGTGSRTAQQITTWVAQNFTARTVSGTTVYDLSP
jgi:4-amino-4-deoxy-L-arabinose transferase-like glycosyltransferase